MSRKLKSMIAVLLSVLMFFTLTVTVFADALVGTTGEESAAGGWTTADAYAGSVPEDVIDGLEAAVQASGFLGGTLNPIAYFAKQLVNGTNYAVLCKEILTTAEPTSRLVIATYTVDSEKNAKNLKVQDFDIADYAKDGDEILFQMGKAGGWQIPEDHSIMQGDPLVAGIETALSALQEGRVGATIEPMAYLGSQVVNGTNYAFLCHIVLTTEDPVGEVAVVTVYENQGEAEISTICTIMSAGSKEEGEGEGEGTETGAWTVKAEEAKLPEAVQAAFTEATTGYLGTDIKPIAYFAQQVVNGMNYGILYTGEMVVQDPEQSEKKLFLAKIGTDTKGKVTNFLASPFNIADFADKEENLLFESGAAGGWIIPADHTTLADVIPFDKSKKADEFEAVVEKLENELVGVDIEVMNYLGCQVVAGTNYAFLCHVATVTEEPENMAAVVIVNVDPEGTISVANICIILDEGAVEPEHTYQFEDVPEDWYTEAIYAVADAGIMTGYEGHKLFGTMDNLSRAQFATILYRMAGEPKVTTSGSFVDVPAGEWYSDAVEWAKAEGIITGYEGTKKFGPADPITREQLVTMIWRRSGSKVVDYALNFKDVKAVSDWALEAIRWAASLNIIEGKDGYIDPQGLTKRCECAAMIYRRINADA